MCITRLTFAIIILAVIALFPLDAICASGRKPIKFYCKLIKKSKFLFWNYESNRSVQIDIYDSDKDGYYDTYKWWEDGALRHKGDFYTDGEEAVCEKRLAYLAKRNLVAYYSDKDDEYFLKVKSKKDNLNLGFLTMDTGFNKSLSFELYIESDLRGVITPYGPAKDPLKDNIFLRFKVDKRKNKLRKTNLYIRYNDNYAIKTYVLYEDHRIVISDIDKDGTFDQCLYVIDECVFAIAAKFVYNVPYSALWKRFYYEILNNDVKVIDFIDRVYRIPLHSRKDNLVIGFLDFKSYGDFLVKYSEVSNFSDLYISTAAKFGLSYPSNIYFEYINFVAREPGFLDPHLRQYRGNIFIEEYLKEREGRMHSPQPESIFSLTANDK